MRISMVARACALRAGEFTELGDEIFFLSFSEIISLLLGKGIDSLQYISERTKVYERYRSLPLYPPVIRGRFDPFKWAADPNRRTDYFDSIGFDHKDMAEELDNQIIRGAPGSAGLAEGVVRILNRAEDGHTLQKGEILVTAQTNIGWTPLFPRAAAVVTDVGAPLSHAAIVARELGIPAVVGCRDATMRLKTGDRVRVNGTQGFIELIGSRFSKRAK
jgi:pyruvate,water dikinase